LTGATTRASTPIRIGLVSGDGLPTSGLLTIFRNVLDIGIAHRLVDLPVPADLGYSWRPDKGLFHPTGDIVDGYPPWLRVVDSSGVARDVEPDPAAMWHEVRAQVAHAETLSEAARAALHARIEPVAAAYQAHFVDWMTRNDIDWVVAVNMTLSDAVPVTLGLHRAARARYGDGRRSGGVVFWDHDLFGSCGIFEAGQRLYPTEPNEFTPLPTAEPHVRWLVVSDELAAEAERYPTPATPRVVPNVLPTVPTGPLEARHLAFAEQRGLAPGRPLILVPVRVFRIKGVEISIELIAAVKAECHRTGLPVPYLLVFGSLDEDPEYAREVLARADALGVTDDVVFLGGVPLGGFEDRDGRWRLDEVDLLRLAAATNGMVVFTPNTPSVETIGLGPALASCAGMPCAVTPYNAFEKVYGSEYRCLFIGDHPGAIAEAGRLVTQAIYDPETRNSVGGGAANLEILRRVFPADEWWNVLQELRQPR
jgi:glycosyltransferase involved in cell wall biosynthesis